MPMKYLHTRKAEITDAELIADMSRQTFYETFAEHNTKTDMDKFLAEQFSKEQLMAQVGVAGNIFLLAYVNDQPAGYLFLKEGKQEQLLYKNAIEISRLYARSLFIGKGVGKALMNAAIDMAKSMHKEAIWLGVWEHNDRAINFYTALGFKKFGEHDFVLGKDVQRDWLMNLII